MEIGVGGKSNSVHCPVGVGGVYIWNVTHYLLTHQRIDSQVAQSRTRSNTQQSNHCVKWKLFWCSLILNDKAWATRVGQSAVGGVLFSWMELIWSRTKQLLRIILPSSRLYLIVISDVNCNAEYDFMVIPKVGGNSAVEVHAGRAIALLRKIDLWRGWVIISIKSRYWNPLPSHHQEGNEGPWWLHITGALLL